MSITDTTQLDQFPVDLANDTPPIVEEPLVLDVYEEDPQKQIENLSNEISVLKEKIEELEKKDEEKERRISKVEVFIGKIGQAFSDFFKEKDDNTSEKNVSKAQTAKPVDRGVKVESKVNINPNIQDPSVVEKHKNSRFSKVIDRIKNQEAKHRVLNNGDIEYGGYGIRTIDPISKSEGSQNTIRKEQLQIFDIIQTLESDHPQIFDIILTEDYSSYKSKLSKNDIETIKKLKNQIAPGWVNDKSLTRNTMAITNPDAVAPILSKKLLDETRVGGHLDRFRGLSQKDFDKTNILNQEARHSAAELTLIINRLHSLTT
jgi:hypothetical protein